MEGWEGGKACATGPIPAEEAGIWSGGGGSEGGGGVIEGKSLRVPLLRPCGSRAMRVLCVTSRNCQFRAGAARDTLCNLRYGADCGSLLCLAATGGLVTMATGVALHGPTPQKPTTSNSKALPRST